MQWQESVLMSMDCITNRKYEEVTDRGSQYGPPGYTGAVHNWPCSSLDEAHWESWPHLSVALLGRGGPVPHPGSSEELVLAARK